MIKGIIIMFAWPKTPAIQVGSWYEGLMKFLGFNKNGYYMAGHSAIVLVNPENGELNYFDFGRYHSPVGHGRIRNNETDPDLIVDTKARFNKNGQITNIDELLLLFDANKDAFHGKNTMYASVNYATNFEKALKFAKKLQNKGAIPYGPFELRGTNCSRFTSSVFRAGSKNVWKKFRLLVPICLTPTTLGNVLVVSSDGFFYEVENNSVKKHKISFSKQLKNWVIPSFLLKIRFKSTNNRKEVKPATLIET